MPITTRVNKISSDRVIDVPNITLLQFSLFNLGRKRKRFVPYIFKHYKGEVMSEENNLEQQVFEPGPLYKKRKTIVEQLKQIPLQTGDIVYNAADVAGPLGIPFSKLIQKFTNSPYSHATVILVEGGEYYAIDVSDWGTRKLRVLDWFDNWYMTEFCVYRIKDKTPEQEECLREGINYFLDMDPHYDFNFTDPNAFYCTESVKYIYKGCGLDLGGAYLLKDIVPWWFYPLILIGNFFTRILSNSSLPTNVPITIVGNDEKGMRASPLTEKVFEYKG